MTKTENLDLREEISSIILLLEHSIECLAEDDFNTTKDLYSSVQRRLRKVGVSLAKEITNQRYRG